MGIRRPSSISDNPKHHSSFRHSVNTVHYGTLYHTSFLFKFMKCIIILLASVGSLPMFPQPRLSDTGAILADEAALAAIASPSVVLRLKSPSAKLLSPKGPTAVSTLPNPPQSNPKSMHFPSRKLPSKSTRSQSASSHGSQFSQQIENTLTSGDSVKQPAKLTNTKKIYSKEKMKTPKIRFGERAQRVPGKKAKTGQATTDKAVGIIQRGEARPELNHNHPSPPDFQTSHPNRDQNLVSQHEFFRRRWRRRNSISIQDAINLNGLGFTEDQILSVNQRRFQKIKDIMEER